MAAPVDRSATEASKQPSNGSSRDSSGPATPPTISLPKGGGAIRGIGEKFAANPVTGTGSMTVPITASPGRSGFGPQLSLSYDSGSGNGPFGFGWSLSLPAITRKTDKGLPLYRGAEESDVFILSGAEDLVPVLDANGKPFEDNASVRGYTIHRYRPRIEGLFARIERWTNADGDAHWRSISKDNILAIYGKDDDSRIADPDGRHRVFSWLICETRDDKGNAVVYEYKPEDGAGVDLEQAHERNRGASDADGRKANRYLKGIKYGNRVPLLDANGHRPRFVPKADLDGAAWMFEVLLDYGEGHYKDADLDAEGRVFATAKLEAPADSFWPARPDRFSSYRAGFEVRTCRLCRRVLMFHHFENELGVPDYLVRSTELTYAETPIASFVTQISQSGYVCRSNDVYLKKSLPPLEFAYTEATVHDEVRVVDPKSSENLPYGLDGSDYQWVDLDGEGISGVLTEQAGAWFYKRNLSPSPRNVVRQNGHERVEPELAPVELVASRPALALAAGAQFMDLAGDGQPDLVQLEGPLRGFYERTEDADWAPFKPFASWPKVDTRDPNLRFVDLDGDGHSDILITEHDVLTWYPSIAEEGFGSARHVSTPLDEEEGPRLVFADGTQSIYLADISGDGLTDLVRIRNGEVCYWPNLGYGRFGAKVTMDDSPWFDTPDQFDQKRIRIADIDGSGNTDIIYLGSDGARLYFNESGNRWSKPRKLESFPPVDRVSSVTAVDLLGNGTACLVWSSPLPGNVRAPMRYIDLMGGQKPHLMVAVANNLGAETKVHYAPSTRFYLADAEADTPWITRLPFPVHVVERVETCDRISRNRFVTRYEYHHGYFDGDEREFRGFGRVDQLDTEEIGAIEQGDEDSLTINLEGVSFVPPVLTRTWFHTGAFVGRDHISDFFAGLLNGNDKGEYYREPGLTDEQARGLLLPDTVLPDALTLDEQREACRALKGSMLRQEVYALDRTEKEGHPYAVTEQNFTVRRMQPRAGNRHAVFFTHPGETLSYHYERSFTLDPADPEPDPQKKRKLFDPRVTHALTLDVGDYGDVLKSASVAYGRRPGKSPLQGDDKEKQERPLIAYTENDVTNPIDDAAVYPNDYRTPLPCEARTYELTGYSATGTAGRFQADDFVQPDPIDGERLTHVFQDEIHYEDKPTGGRQRRLIERVRTLYRNDDLTLILPFRDLGRLALPGESYKLAFTPGLIAHVYQRPLDTHQPPAAPLPVKLLPNAAPLLEGKGTDEGGYVQMDGNWWIPSDRVFFDPDAEIDNAAATAGKEIATARRHFFLPRKFADPFGRHTIIDYDERHDLLVVRTEDAIKNIVTAANDYRVLQANLVTDPNLNRTAVAFDALGMVVATALMGKTGQNVGDVLENFDPDPHLAALRDFVADPRGVASQLLGKTTTRTVYDLDRFGRCGQAPFVASLARETHVSDPGGAHSKSQVSLSYSDGFGREIQKKVQAEAGEAPQRQNDLRLPTGDVGPGDLVRAANGRPAEAKTQHRWVGTGRTVFNNKGKPVRQYEPFFSATHLYEDEREMTDSGVSPVLFYDPVERLVATLHPNHTYEKVVFDPWRQVSWDVNDTLHPKTRFDPRTPGVLPDHAVNPASDPDVGDFLARLPEADYLPTWLDLRMDAAKALARWPDARVRTAEQQAAEKAARHSATPTVAHFDCLGRAFLTVADNGMDQNGNDLFFQTRIDLDIEGNQREVIDAKGRVVMRYDYDLLGNRMHQASMEAGERWMLNDVAGKPIRAWDSRGHNFKTEYDVLRRPVRQFVSGTDTNQSDPRTLNQDVLFEQIEYGEQQNVDLNLRTRVFKQWDGAGIVTTEASDFKGNLLRTSRELSQSYDRVINWAVAQPPGETFTSSTTYDALNRPLTVTTPDNSVYRPTFNEANLLDKVEVNLRGAAVATAFVANIDYNAKGQRTRIDYPTSDGRLISTTYEYDPETFRLTHLYTRRGIDPVSHEGDAFETDCENPDPPPPDTIAAPEIPPPGRMCGLQNLHYTYDPAGNITHIRDDAQQTIYFRNQRVEPSNEYTYDAIYRLIEAAGREHLGQVGGSPIPHSYNDVPRVGLLHPGDGNAMGTYTERYAYDEVGNFREMVHRGDDPAHRGWTRTYEYKETSLIEDGTGGTLLKTSNRLSRTTVNANGGQPAPETYSYDTHGNMLRMSHLQLMQWDFKDQLQMTQRQAVNAADTDGVKHQGERTYYVYDSTGERVRKVTELGTGKVKNERIYLGGFEMFRENGANPLERETLHVMDDKQRIALVETRTQGNDGSPPELIRYQFGNHLGSASLALSDQAQVVSYEEYTPYGITSYRAVRSQIETPKRYRYTGKERDEESGLYYHGARYYAPWLGRWTTCDPVGLIDGTNAYQYVSGNPNVLADPSGLEGESPTTTVPVPFALRMPHEMFSPISAVQTSSSFAGKAWGVAKATAFGFSNLAALAFNSVSTISHAPGDAVARITGNPQDAESFNFAFSMLGPGEFEAGVMGLSALAAKAESVIASTKLGLQARILSSRLEGELAVPPTGRSDLNYIPDLPKVDSGHILRGVERPKPSASGNVTVSKPGGFHHEPSGVPGRAEVIRGTRSRSDNLGVYSARVRLRNDATKDFLASSPQSSGPKFREKFSTMFPASMPDFRVIQSIKDAWRNRLAIGGSDIGRAASYPLTPSGGTLWLRMHSSAPDAIRSAWPLRSYSEMLQVPLLKRPTYRAK